MYVTVRGKYRNFLTFEQYFTSSFFIMDKISIQFDPYHILLNTAIKQAEESLGRPLLAEELASIKVSIKNLLNPSLDIDDSEEESNQSDFPCEQSFDLKEFSDQCMDTFRQNIDNCKSEEELLRFLHQVDKGLSELEKKWAKIELENQIEDLAHDIRMVVVGCVTIKHEPYPYIFKKEYPLIKQSHLRIIAMRKTDIYLKSIEFAKKDMFQGDFKIYEYSKDMKKYFEVYTDNPLLFNISAVLDFLPFRYKSAVQDLIIK